MNGEKGYDVVTYRLDLEYDGTELLGWQIQPDGRTVQGFLQQALGILFGEEITVIAAGRTDAGVHASGQVAHFRSHVWREPETVRKALNSMLPLDIRVRAVLIAESDFHARYSAQWRGYTYLISKQPLAIGRSYCWWGEHSFDLERMQRATSHILGSHCFKSFAHPNHREKHYLSTVYRAEWTETERCYEFQIDANRFLHGMVRFLVGTFAEVGRGRTDSEGMIEILAAEDVSRAGAKAPAHGLTLKTVGYRPWPEI